MEGTFATRKIFHTVLPKIWQLFWGEFLGTFILVLTVTCNILGNSQAAALSIACSLSAMIYALGDAWILQRWPTYSREFKATGHDLPRGQEGTASMELGGDQCRPQQSSSSFLKGLGSQIVRSFPKSSNRRIYQHIKDFWIFLVHVHFGNFFMISTLFLEIRRFRMRPLAHSFPAPRRGHCRPMACGRAVAMLTLMGATELPYNAVANTEMPDFDCVQDIRNAVKFAIAAKMTWKHPCLALFCNNWMILGSSEGLRINFYLSLSLPADAMGFLR